MTPTQRIYSVTDLGVGDRIITACPLVGGPFRSILVDRGFLETGGADRLTPSMRPETRPVVGVLRRGGAGSALAPVRRRGQEWFSRDVGGIAAALHAPDPAPVFFMLESPRPEGFGPLPAPIPSDIPNNHLGYALTWFGLAAGLIGVYLASRLKGRRAL
jgi:surfeit locus 1 family protein